MLIIGIDKLINVRSSLNSWKSNVDYLAVGKLKTVPFDLKN